MNLEFYLEKLHSSESFKKFMKENPDAFLCSGFFVIDKEEKNPDNKQHLDYYCPKKKKMFSFQLEEGVKLTEVEIFDKELKSKISIDKDFDFKDIEKVINSKMFDEKVKNKVQKLIFSLQSLNNKAVLVGTIFISGLGMLKVNIDLSEMKIVLFEKKSFLNLMKRVK